MIREGSAVACAKRRDALFRPVYVGTNVGTSAEYLCKMLREGTELANTLPLQALMDIRQITSMRVNMKEPVKLEPLKKIVEIRRFSKKELRLTKGSMAILLKSSEYCGPFRKNSYDCVSGIVGMAYNPFINEDILDCYFEYEQALEVLVVKKFNDKEHCQSAI